MAAARLIIGLMAASTAIAVVAGALFSDKRYADQLIQQHQLKTPRDAFEFVIGRKQQQPHGAPVCNGRSFRRLVDDPSGKLWCDEGAIVIAVLAQRLGHDTRLVDLHHQVTDISHHTIVEIKEESGWRAYDFTGRRAVDQACDSVDYPCRAVRRTYPTMTHEWLLSNGLLRKGVEVWKGRSWDPSCW